MRITLQNVADSRIPQTLGLCSADIPRLASFVNEAQQRLIQAGGENGWWGSWAKVLFNVQRSDPYITLPYEFARLVAMDVCRVPVKIQNEWYEFLDDSAGLQNNCACGPLQSYERGSVPTAYDLTPTNQKIRVYYTDVRDVGKRVLVSNAKDQNGNGIYTQDGINPVIGFYLSMAAPFVTSDYIVTSFSVIAKDETYGDVIIKEVDATSGVERLLARLGPKITTPQYRRYYLHGIPQRCCSVPSDDTDYVRVTAMCKYEYAPVSRPSDFLLIGNIPALKEECNAVRHSEMEDLNEKAKAKVEHMEAIKLLNLELTHYLGTQRPAIGVKPWGTATLGRRMIGQLT